MEAILANIGLYTGYVLLGLMILIAFGFTVIDIMRSPGAAVKSLIGIGTFAVIILISYLLASGESAERHDDIGQQFALFTSTALHVLYITGILAIIGIIGSLIYELLLESFS